MSLVRRGAAALLLSVGALAARRAGAQGFRVVAHPALDVSALPAATISRLFLRQVRTFPGGVPARPVDLAPTSPTRAAFSVAVHRRPVAKVQQYWQGQIFAGGETPPVSKASDGDVLAFIRATPGAIGYVSASADVAGVKVISIQ